MTIDSTHPQSLELQTRPVGWLVTTSRICFGISILIVASLAIGLFFFAVPVWDDLIRATRPKDVGWWGYVYGFVYNHWQGRWASCGLESFVLPRVDISRYYWVLLGGIGVINITAAYLLCRRFTRSSNRFISLAMTVGLLALLWTGMPSVHDKTTGRIMSSVSETVYWFTGAVENAMVYALAIFVLLGITGLPAGASLLKKALVAAALCLAAIIVCGFHELYGLMFCLALGLGSVASIMDRDRKAGVWITVTAAAGIGLLVVILAPGNTARFASDGGSHARHFRYDLIVALAQAVHYGGHWLIDPKLLGLSAWMLTTPVLIQPPTTSRFPWRWMVPLAWSIMLAAGFFAPSWAFGNWMPPRTIAGVYIIFVLGWFITLWLWLPVIRPMLGKTPRARGPIGIIIFSLTMVLTGTAWSVMHDYATRVRPWHRAMENRYAMLRKSPAGDALVSPLPKPPWNLLDGEIVNDAGDYRNWSTVSFFHLRSVRLVPAQGSPPPPPEKPTRPPAKGMGT